MPELFFEDHSMSLHESLRAAARLGGTVDEVWENTRTLYVKMMDAKSKLNAPRAPKGGGGWGGGGSRPKKWEDTELKCPVDQGVIRKNLQYKAKGPNKQGEEVSNPNGPYMQCANRKWDNDQRKYVGCSWQKWEPDPQPGPKQADVREAIAQANEGTDPPWHDEDGSPF